MIYVDADSCPVKDTIIKLAKLNNIQVIMYFDQSHMYESDYATVRIVEQGHDSVDIYIINDMKKGDIVVTNDYGLSALVLARGGYPITCNGVIINNDNINNLLDTRYIGQKERARTHRVKGPKKRTIEDENKFYLSLQKLIENVKS